MTRVGLDLSRVTGDSQIQVVRVDSRDLAGEPLHCTMIAGPYAHTAGNGEEAWAALDAYAAAHPEIPKEDLRVIVVYESEIDLPAIVRGLE